MADITDRKLRAPRALVSEVPSRCVLASQATLQATDSSAVRSCCASPARPSFATCRFMMGSATAARSLKARRRSSSRWRLSRCGVRPPGCARWQKRQSLPAVHSPRENWMQGLLQSPGCPTLPMLHSAVALPRTARGSLSPWEASTTRGVYSLETGVHCLDMKSASSWDVVSDVQRAGVVSSLDSWLRGDGGHRVEATETAEATEGVLRCE
mmetsp:Transcript_21525/g.47971  ORF Transcript_21525/g.47971 Transcript_21525/m.47971 type:complete len:211 (-) Transcript_21525:79-711(-)